MSDQKNPQPDLPTTLRRLAADIELRRAAAPAESYTAKLLHGEPDALLKKIVEEAGETALAAKGGDKRRIVAEMCDLLYHCLVLAARYNIAAADIAAELSRRAGTSGLAEKVARHGAARGKTASGEAADGGEKIIQPTGEKNGNI